MRERLQKWFSYKRNIVLAILAAVVLVLILATVDLYRSKYSLMTTYYRIDSGRLAKPIRVTQLTDLHAAQFGEGNCRLLEEVSGTNPDIIVITGDLVDSHHQMGMEQAVELLQNLMQIAPVYVSYGNQELELETEQGISIRALYEESGAVVLEQSYRDIEIRGQRVRIGGIYSHGIALADNGNSYGNAQFQWMQEFQNTDAYKILLFHIPNFWLSFGSNYDWDVDVVFAGHDHGGQIRFPLIGGLWAPDRGWFPGQECGVYTTEEAIWQQRHEKIGNCLKKNGLDSTYFDLHSEYVPTSVVLSRGLGNTDSVPRFNNIPEVVAVDLR